MAARTGSPPRRKGSPSRETSPFRRTFSPPRIVGSIPRKPSPPLRRTPKASYRSDDFHWQPLHGSIAAERDVPSDNQIEKQQAATRATTTNDCLFSRSRHLHQPRTRFDGGPLTTCPEQNNPLTRSSRTPPPPSRPTPPPPSRTATQGRASTPQRGPRTSPTTHVAAREATAAFAGTAEKEKAAPLRAELSWAIARSERRHCRLMQEMLALQQEHPELFSGTPCERSVVKGRCHQSHEGVCRSRKDTGESCGHEIFAAGDCEQPSRKEVARNNKTCSCNQSSSNSAAVPSMPARPSELEPLPPRPPVHAPSCRAAMQSQATAFFVDDVLDALPEYSTLYAESTSSRSLLRICEVEEDFKLESVLQGLPPKASGVAEKLRLGFSRLRAEVKTLQQRHEQQQVVSRHLEAQLASRDALENRFSALEAEKDTLTEWCSLRAAECAWSPVVDRNAFVAVGLAEAHATALQLYEQRLMLEEDYLSTRAQRLAPRVEPAELCEKLCMVLHQAEEELTDVRKKEERLRAAFEKSSVRENPRKEKANDVQNAEFRLVQQRLKLMQVGEEARKRHQAMHK